MINSRAGQRRAYDEFSLVLDPDVYEPLRPPAIWVLPVKRSFSVIVVSSRLMSIARPIKSDAR